MRDEGANGRRSFRVPRTSRLVAAALAVGVGLTVAGYLVLNRERAPTIDFVVPDGYLGWLVVGWECAGGQPLAAYRASGENRYVIRYEPDGTACLSDVFPDNGYLTKEKVYASGGPAPVLSGYTRGARVVLTPGAAPVEARWIFSIDALREDGGRVLGDNCDLDAFLFDRFDYPLPTVPRCEPLYAQGRFGTATPSVAS